MRQINCTFELNKQPTSRFTCTGFGGVVAFSGDGPGLNNPDATGIRDVGPVPTGTYYIVDRESGGFLGPLRDAWTRYGVGTTDHTKWFALWHPETGDHVMVGGARRGEFRLHPMGRAGLSQGCIVILNPVDFNRLEHYLRSSKPEIPIPGTHRKAYGTVEVR